MVPVLVVGAAGRVGRAVVTELLRLGRPVRALVRRPPPTPLPAGVEVVVGDLTEPDSLTSALAGVEALFLVWATVATERPSTSEATFEVCSFFQMVRGLADAARVALGHIQGFVDSIESVEKTSRDLRPVLRRLRQGLTTITESREIGDGWMARIDAIGLDCDETTTSEAENNDPAPA